MAVDTKIMTAAQVVSEALVDINTDEALFDKNILFSQRKYIRSVLGEDLYDLILVQIASTVDMTAENQILIEDYIRPCLARYVVYESMPGMRIQISSQGLMLNNETDQTRQSAAFDYGTLRNTILSQAEFYKQDLIDYMTDNPDDNADITTYWECDNDTANQTGGGILPY